MDFWQIAASVLGTLLSGAVGFVWSRLSSHESRLVKVETIVEGELRHLQADLFEIKTALNTANREIQHIREQLAGG